MRRIIIALLIGTGAGILDITPMIIQKMDNFTIASAFFHWLALGLIIPFIKWKIISWLKGIIISLFFAIPVLFIVYPTEPESVLPITLASVILGALVGLLGNRFVLPNA